MQCRDFLSKKLSSLCHHQQTPPLTATSDECHQVATVRRHCVYLTVTASTTREIMVENSYFFIPDLHSTLPLWVVPVGILPWHLVWKNCGYPGSKNYKDMFIPFDRMHQRDGRTERQTDTVRWQPALMQCFLDARKRLRKIQHFSSGTIISGRSSFWQTTNLAYLYFRYRAIVHGLSHREKFAGR